VAQVDRGDEATVGTDSNPPGRDVSCRGSDAPVANNVRRPCRIGQTDDADGVSGKRPARSAAAKFRQSCA